MRIAVFVAVMVVLAGLGYWRGAKVASTAAALVMTAHLEADRKAELDQADKVRKLENDLAAAQAVVSESYEKGKRDAEAKGAAVVADLRAGNLRLQRRWSGCEAQRLPDTAAATGEHDAGSRDRDESAGRIVLAAARCDAQVRGLQRLLILERELLNEQ